METQEDLLKPCTGNDTIMVLYRYTMRLKKDHDEIQQSLWVSVIPKMVELSSYIPLSLLDRVEKQHYELIRIEEKKIKIEEGKIVYFFI